MRSASTDRAGGRGGRADGARRAGPDDLERLLPLWRDLLDHHAERDDAFAVDGDVAAALRRTARAALRDTACAVFVWETGAGELEGLCIVRLDTAPAGVREPARARVTEIAVAPAVRRRGVGRALARAALAWASDRGAARAEVRVAVRNPEGQAFWRALGFGDFVDVLERRL